VIIEGVVETLSDDRKDEFVKAYIDAFEFDPSAMSEPIHIVRPKTAFGFIDVGDQFTTSATRWTF
jgi:hypothetical protein